MNSWFRQHAHALKSALAHLRSGPGNFIFNVLVVAISLALPIAGLTIIENLRPISQELSIDPEISIFLKTDIPRNEATALSISIKQQLKAAKIAANLRFTPKEKALAALSSAADVDELISTLGANPLPDAYVLSFSHIDVPKMDSFIQQLKKIPEVELVQVDSAWINRLSALLQIMQISLLFLSVTLGAVVIVVVFNATRLQVMSHHAEIVISRLLGATNSFIRKPYYYTGALLGLLACGVALGGIALALNPLNLAITEFAKLYQSEFHLAPLSLPLSACVLVISMLLGLFGAFLSARRQLARTL